MNIQNIISGYCYNYALNSVTEAIPVIEKLYQYYPLILVSNFYGNINSVLKDFGLDSFFKTIVESAVVGVRKPDPEIFNLGVKALGLDAENVVVIGDSFSKDIAPASKLGCKTIWIKGLSWDNKEDDIKHPAIISSLDEVIPMLMSGK